MEDRVRLGRTDLYVCPIGLGTNAVGGHNLFPNLDEQAGRDLVRAAIENGLNFIDTAYIYGNGRSEEIIGEIVRDKGGREDLVIASKASYKLTGPDPRKDVVHDNSPEFLKRSVDESLKRLQTDYIDLFYIHFPDNHTPKDEAVGALKELKDEGKIRAIGVSNFSLEQLKEANQDGYVDVYQGEYNLLSRSAEKELFPYAIEHDISFVPYFPLASGLLTGKYRLDTNLEGKRGKFFERGLYEETLGKIDRLRTIAEAKQADVANLVLAWYLTRDAIDVVIPGAKGPEQVIRNMKTRNIHLTAAETAEIEQIFN